MQNHCDFTINNKYIIILIVLVIEYDEFMDYLHCK